jgi:hypothetical protein
MSDINQMVIRASMRNMFIKGYLDICAIKECLKLANITPHGQTMGQLQALHCVHFKDMDRELAEMMPEMVVNLFDGMHLSVDDLFAKPVPARRAEVIDITPPAPEKRGFLQMIGVK